MEQEDTEQQQGCERCKETRRAAEFVSAKSGNVTPWCLRCRRLWSAEKNGIRCRGCGEVFLKTSKKDAWCEACRAKLRALPVQKSETRPGSLLNPAIDLEAQRRYRETVKRLVETQGAPTW